MYVRRWPSDVSVVSDLLLNVLPEQTTDAKEKKMLPQTAAHDEKRNVNELRLRDLRLRDGLFTRIGELGMLPNRRALEVEQVRYRAARER